MFPSVRALGGVAEVDSISTAFAFLALFLACHQAGRRLTDWILPAVQKPTEPDLYSDVAREIENERKRPRDAVETPL